MEQPTYIQEPGNRRFVCPSCKHPSIQPITLPLTGYVCPVTKCEVTVEQIGKAQTLAYLYDRLK